MKILPPPSGETEFITPKWLTDSLGPFSVDICAARNSYNTIGKRRNYYGPTGSGDCGLAAKLRPKDFVWCNPPFGMKNGESEFIGKMSGHGNGILLVPAKTGSVAWHKYIFGKAVAIGFFKALRFHGVDGGDSVLIGGISACCVVCFGEEAKHRLLTSGLDVGVI